MSEHKFHCEQHAEFVSAVTELVSSVSVLSTNLSWMERMGKWVAGLCVSIMCLVVVGIFWAGALYQQVQVNTEQIKSHHATSAVVIGGAVYVTEPDEISSFERDTVLL